jgi:hypothetical protein
VLFLDKHAHIAYIGSMNDEPNKTVRIQLMVTPAEVESVDEWMFQHRVRGRSEAIRQLIHRGMECDGDKPEDAQKPGRKRGSRQ